MNWIIKALTSTKFAIAIIALFIVLSIIGTIYPGGDAIFGSPAFLALIGLLALSTALCSLTRIVPLWRIVTKPEIQVSDQFIEALPYHAKLSDISISQVKANLAGYKWHEARSSETTFLFAQRGRISRFGPHVAHLGILVLLLGVALGTAYANTNPYNNKIAVISMGSSQQVDGFALQLNSFNVSYYDNGVVKDYTAAVTIIDGNQIQARTISVNAPLTYKGLTFYLYGYDSNGIAEYGNASWVAFQIKSDAGVPLVWFGAIVTVTGLVLSLYVSHKRIWIKVSNEDVLIGAASNKRSSGFFAELDKQRAELERHDTSDKARSKKI